MSAFYHSNLADSQNFIKDPRLVATLIERCSIEPEDVVYEIGPGKGIITAQLAQRCKQVVAIEKDPGLSAGLRQKFASQPNLIIRAADFLSCPLPKKPYKVFSNIPFNLTSAIVARLTTAPNPPEDAWLVIQEEAAEMFLGNPRESLRSVLLKPWFELELVHRFRRFDFTPQPHVDCVLLHLRKRSLPLVNRSDRQRFRDFVVYGFTAWRPALGEIFKDIFSWRQLKQISRADSIDLNAKPTALSFEDWLSLFNFYQEIASPQAIRRISGSEQRLCRQQAKLQKVHRTRK